jgi:hypothetical protein
MGMMVTLSLKFSFLIGLGCIFSGFFRSPMQYMHHPMRNMKMSAGKSMILIDFLRLCLRFEATNFDPDYFQRAGKISFDNLE